MSEPEAELDQIFDAPLDEFIAVRDRLSRDLRSRGDRDGAESLKRVRKPSVSAWAINRLQHHHPQQVSELLAAGSRLREAQEALLAGGDRGLLRSAAAEERRLVGELVRLAVAESERAGHPVGPAIQTRIHETLHAAAGDQEARELLALGRLQRDYELGDLGLLGTGHVDAGHRHAATRAPGRKTDTRRRLASIERRLQQARARQDEMRSRLGEAETAMREAQRVLARADSAAKRAAAKVDHARGQLDAATTKVAELESERDQLG